MSNDESFSRSRRSKPAEKENKFALLQNIKRAHESGTKHREDYKEEDIFKYVTEEDLQKIKEKRLLENDNDGDSDYFDDGREIFDESDDETTIVDKKRKKTMRNSNIKRIKSVVEPGKHKQPTVADLFTKAAPTKKPVENVNFDDLLEEFERTNKPTNKYVKKVAAKSQNPFSKSAEKPRFNINSPKPVVGKVRNLEKKAPKKKVEEIVIPVMEVFHDDSMASWNEEVMTMMDTQVTTDTLVTPATQDESNIAEFDEIMSMDFDKPFHQEKGYCESTKKINAPSVMWDKDELITSQRAMLNDQVTFDSTEDKNVTRIYWIDAYQDVKIAGVVFIFGKMYNNTEKKFVNCCVKITDLERRLYFLPRTDCSMTDVHQELVSIFDKYNVQQFRCKMVTKHYAFQLAEVPNSAEYMMVQYNAKHAALPSDITGRTFSHVFGCETSILELLILDLKLKGPCWLNFADLKTSSAKFSISKFDYEIHGIKGISKCEGKLPSPPLTLLSLHMKTVVDANTSTNEIVSVGGFIHNEISFDQPPPTKIFHNHFTILTHPKDSVMPYDLNQKIASTAWGTKYNNSVTVAPNERALISNLLATIHKNDPDIIIGHSLFGHQLQMLLQRCKILNISLWYRLGRLNRSVPLQKLLTGRSNAWIERMATAGRLICDTEFSGRELVKCRSYELSEMVKNILPAKLHGLQNLSSIGDLRQLFLNSAGMKQLIDLTLDEAISNIYLMHELQILPLAYQITAICGNLIARTLSSGKSERNEYLLLHAFNDKDYITPDKYSKSKEIKEDITGEDFDKEAEGTGKRKPTYAGGLVLEPKKGFYENFILLMDFNSLYPSIIQEFNICFTTIDRHKYLNSGSTQIGNNDGMTSEISTLMDLATNAQASQPGILPTEIRKLVESRKQVKSLLSAPDLSNEKKMQYDIRQKALKITANSMYGCLGFSQSRFKATQLASLITCQGREILQRTKTLVESGNITYKVNNVPTKMKLEIVYGDTDSIMVNTGLSKLSDYDTVMGYGKRIKDEVNKLYKNIQIDIDGLFRRLLLLKKKKYAALTITKNGKTGAMETKQELKGLDIVRRDWCKLAVDVGHKVLTQILEGELSQEDLAMAIGSYLSGVKDEVNNSKMMLDRFVITKALARNPESYANAQGQPHVQVALRHNKSGAAKQFRAQDTVEYIICEDGSTKNPIQRAYSPTEVLGRKDTLKVDTHYYLSHQLHPVVSRLVDGIDDLSPAFVAESLGLDAKAYVKHDTKTGDTHAEEEEAMTGADNKYKQCKPLMVECLSCRTMNELSTPIVANTTVARKLWPCVNCKSEMITVKTINHVMNTLTRTVRQYQRQYYSSVYTCQELLCGYKCHESPVVIHHANTTRYTATGQWLCPHCGHGVMRPVIDHTELYNQIMYFDYLFTDKKKDDALITIRKHVQSMLDRSAYCIVDLKKFSDLLI